MNDIQSREDIEVLIRAFYEKAVKHEMIGRFFTEIIPLNLDEHLPKMFDFWEMVLFDGNNYKGNPMQIHLDLNAKSPLQEAHFKAWIHLFNATVDELFEGKNAEVAKTRALSMATMIHIKTHQQ